MAENKKVSELDAASALTGNELLHVVQGGNSRQTTVAEVAAHGTVDTFSDLATLADGDVDDGEYVVVMAGFNGEPETFAYDDDSALTADGALVVDAAGMSGGRFISTRTVYADFDELEADVRTFDAGVVLNVSYGSTSLVSVASSGDVVATGGQNFDIVTGPNFTNREVSTASECAKYPDDTIVVLAGERLIVDSSATGNDSATSDLSVNGLREPYRIDVLLVIGQSNAEGRGDSASSPTSPTGIEAGGSVIVDPLADPVGGAITGSMWPAFANEWNARTGHRLAVVESATGGTGLLPDAGGEWSPSGALRSSAVDTLKKAIKQLRTAYPTYDIGDVNLLWAQGEADAQAINGSTVTGDLYKSALIELAGYFRANIPEMGKMGVIRLGSASNRSDADDWAEIRAAQDEACATSDNLLMLYRGTSGFPTDGRKLMANTLHWDQSGLDIAGELSAIYLSTNTSPEVPAAPSILGTEVFADTDPTVNQTTRTDSHTTASGTKMLLVAVTSEIVNTNNTRNVTGVTFDGVVMTEANAADTGVAAGNSSPDGRVDVGLFYLTEADYGSSLSGVTGDIVTTMSSATNMLSAVAVDLDAEGIQEAGFTDNFGGLFGGTPTDTTSAVLVAGAPCAVVAIQSSVATSGAALTHTLAGATFTEVTDSGGDNGSGKSGQRVVATASVAEGVYTITGTLSANADCGVLYVVGFRGKLAGE